MPESPRWLMTQERYGEAYLVFRRIGKSNKKNLNECPELQELKHMKKSKTLDLQLNQRLNETSQFIEKHVN